MDTNALSGKLTNAIRQAQKNEAERTVIFEKRNIQGKHEFLFFIKPEITIASDSIQLKAILELILNKTDAFGLHITNAILLPASYLEKHNIIARHYGVINALARNALEQISGSGEKKFEQEFGVSPRKCTLLGGIEFLEAFPEFTPATLDYLWQNSPVVKLGGGAYAQALRLDNEPVYLVNGFHPRQLEHFTSQGRSIVAFTLIGDLNWSDARNRFVGKTNPNDAERGSIRRDLLERKEELGLQAVNSSWNGVHLSAGPLEGLIELIRYNSDLASANELPVSHFGFGHSLKKHFDDTTLQRIMANERVKYGGKAESLFDLTEEKDADAALSLLKDIFQ